MGIIGGTIDDMLNAINKVRQVGKGLYAMKALAGGHLINDIKDAYTFARNVSGISSVAVGMVTPQELDINIRLFNNEDIKASELPSKVAANKQLIISFLCKGCGTCVETCPSSALRLENGTAIVDKKSCLLCGYCNPVCPEFAIRLA